MVYIRKTITFCLDILRSRAIQAPDDYFTVYACTIYMLRNSQDDVMLFSDWRFLASLTNNGIIGRASCEMHVAANNGL